MKKLIIALMLVLLCGNVFGGRFSTDEFKNLQRDSNCKIITPKDNISTAYAWLKSSDRDGQMGALAWNNRRTLILSPGVYDLAATTVTLDTDHVDIKGYYGTGSVEIKTNDGIVAFKQTAFEIVMENLTFITNDAVGIQIDNQMHSGTNATLTGENYPYFELEKAGEDFLEKIVRKYDWVYLTGTGIVSGWYRASGSLNETVVYILYDRGLSGIDFESAPTDVTYKFISNRSIYKNLRFNMCNVTALQSGIYYITDFGGHFENCNSNTRKSQASSSFWPDSGKKNLASFSVNAGRTMQCDPTGTIHLDVFYNYSTFLNSINESPATYALPDAVPGRRFTVVREDPTAGADVIIDPKSTDIIIKIDGTPMAAGESYQNVSDAFGMVTLECFRIGFWQVVEILGTWVEETPP